MPCKQCKRAASLKWILENKERVKAKAKTYRETHKRERAEYMKNWNKAHPRRGKAWWQRLLTWWRKL